MSFNAHLSNLRKYDDAHIFNTTCLVDSGCTAIAFADEKLIVKNFRILPKPLKKPRTLRLADGSSHATISQYFTCRMHLGPHSEIIVFYVNNLSNSNPLILGIPWLQLHNPICD